MGQGYHISVSIYISLNPYRYINISSLRICYIQSLFALFGRAIVCPRRKFIAESGNLKNFTRELQKVTQQRENVAKLKGEKLFVKSGRGLEKHKIADVLLWLTETFRKQVDKFVVQQAASYFQFEQLIVCLARAG